MERTEWGDHRDRPAAIADGTHCLVHGLTTDAIEEQVDAAGDYGTDLFDPVGGVVVEDFAGAQAPQVLMVAWAGHAQGAGAHGRRDLHGGAAHASRCGGDEHGFAGLQQPPVDQAIVGGPGADHQPGRLLEARLVGHGGQAVRRRQRQFGEPATRREQTPVHPIARLDAGPVTGRLDDAGDFLTRDERQGNPGKPPLRNPTSHGPTPAP